MNLRMQDWFVALATAIAGATAVELSSRIFLYLVWGIG